MNAVIPGAFPKDAWELLSPRLTAARRGRILAAAAQRTNHVRLVIQDVHNPHNVSACMRSAEAFGVLNVDVVTMQAKFKVSTVAKGVSNWLRIERHMTAEGCAAALKAAGYRLAGGMPAPHSLALTDIPIDRPVAVLFGNENAGLSPDWLPYLDYQFTIPMRGLVESLNISVAAAVTLFSLTGRAGEAMGRAATLSEAEQTELLNEWICNQTPAYALELERLRNPGAKMPVLSG